MFPELAVKGYEVLCHLVAHGRQLRSEIVRRCRTIVRPASPLATNVSGSEAACAALRRLRFVCADAVSADVGDAELVYLDNEAWDLSLRRAIARKLARLLGCTTHACH